MARRTPSPTCRIATARATQRAAAPAAWALPLAGKRPALHSSRRRFAARLDLAIAFRVTGQLRQAAFFNNPSRRLAVATVRRLRKLEPGKLGADHISHYMGFRRSPLGVDASNCALPLFYPAQCIQPGLAHVGLGPIEMFGAIANGYLNTCFIRLCR